jgi:hypothetical protein
MSGVLPEERGRAGPRLAARNAHVGGGEITMTHLMHAKHRHVSYFHSHPLHGTFSLIASLVLAWLIVITVLVTTAR